MDPVEQPSSASPRPRLVAPPSPYLPAAPAPPSPLLRTAVVLGVAGLLSVACLFLLGLIENPPRALEVALLIGALDLTPLAFILGAVHVVRSRQRRAADM